MVIEYPRLQSLGEIAGSSPGLNWHKIYATLAIESKRYKRHLNVMGGNATTFRAAVGKKFREGK
jgi:hypothetical protein